MRTIIRGCICALLITVTACLCIAMILGTMQAITAPEQAPAPEAPRACGIFDDCRVDASSVEIRH